MLKSDCIASIISFAAFFAFTTCGSTPPRVSRIKSAPYETAKLDGKIVARLAGRWLTSDGREMVFSPPNEKNRGKFRRFNAVSQYPDISRAIFSGTYLILAENTNAGSLSIRLEFKKKHAVNEEIEERFDFAELEVDLKSSSRMRTTQVASNFSEDVRRTKFQKPILSAYKRAGTFRSADLERTPAVPAKFKIPADRDRNYRGSCKIGPMCVDVFSPPGNPDKKEVAAGLIVLVIMGQRGCVSIGTATSGRRCDRRRANAICRGKNFRPGGSPEGTKVQLTYVLHNVVPEHRKKLSATCKQEPINAPLMMR